MWLEVRRERRRRNRLFKDRSFSLKNLDLFCLDYKQIEKNIENDAGWFDHCQLKNLKVHLNSEVFSYEDFRAD